MRLRRNHQLQPKLTEMALDRCKELILEAQRGGYDRVWVNAQLYGEFDANCEHIVETVMNTNKLKLD